MDEPISTASKPSSALVSLRPVAAHVRRVGPTPRGPADRVPQHLRPARPRAAHVPRRSGPDPRGDLMPTTRDPRLILDVDTADESVLDQALNALSELRAAPDLYTSWSRAERSASISWTRPTAGTSSTTGSRAFRRPRWLDPAARSARLSSVCSSATRPAKFSARCRLGALPAVGGVILGDRL